MNYGYNPTPYDEELVAQIEPYLKNLEPDARGMNPYVEWNSLYPGVRVRRLTHYSDEQIDNIVKTLDAIYEKVVPKKYWKVQHD